MWEFFKSLDPKEAITFLLVLIFWEVAKLGKSVIVNWEKLTGHKKKEKERELHFHKLIDDVVEISSLMQDLVDQGNITRVLLMKATNGGRIPVLGENLYSKVLYEKKHSSASSISNYIDNILLDPTSIKTLQKIITEGIIRVPTEFLGEGSLKDLFQADSVPESILAHITSFEHSIFYCIIHLTEGHEDTPEFRVSLNNFLQRIKSIFDSELLLKHYSDEIKKRIGN